VSWGTVSFIAASTGDDHAPQSKARKLEQACAENLCTQKRTLPYGASFYYDGTRYFDFSLASWWLFFFLTASTNGVLATLARR